MMTQDSDPDSGVTMQLDTIVKGGTVVTPGGTFVGDVGIAGEKISALGAALDSPGAAIVDASGHYVIPGVLDVHVHLELPFCGTVSADDYRTGTRRSEEHTSELQSRR